MREICRPHDEAAQLWLALFSLFSSVCHLKKYPDIQFTSECILTHWNYNRSKDGYFFGSLNQVRGNEGNHVHCNEV